MSEKISSQLEKAIADTPARLRSVLRDVRAGLTIVDAHSGRIIFASQRACRLLGYRLSEIFEKNLTFFDITHRDDLTLNREQHQLLLAGKLTQYTTRKRYHRKDGSVLNGILTASLIGTGDDDLCLAMGVLIDADEERDEDADRFEQRVIACERYVRANLDQRISIAGLARAVGTSPRTLHRDFLRGGFASPMAYVKKLRLERAREMLLTPRAVDSVTAIGLRCGFKSLGKFSSDYSLAFGELPSETLSRGQALTRASRG